MMEQSLDILAYVQGTDSDTPLTFLVNDLDLLLCARRTAIGEKEMFPRMVNLS